MASGVDRAKAAAVHQLQAGYVPDLWFNVTLTAMMKVWEGIGGNPSLTATEGKFFFGEEDARHARGSYVNTTPYEFAETLWRSLQVRPHKLLGFREGIRELVVDLDAPAALSVCEGSRQLGTGGALQYFILSGDLHRLRETGRTYHFGRTTYPRPAW